MKKYLLVLVMILSMSIMPISNAFASSEGSEAEAAEGKTFEYTIGINTWGSGVPVLDMFGDAKEYTFTTLGCTVNRIISSGAFVQVSDQLEGFLPISQIADRRLESVNEVLKVGDLISVRILNIDKDQLRLSVSMKGVDQQNVNVSEPAADTKTEESENKAE